MTSHHPLLILAGALTALSLGCGGKSVQGSGGAAGTPTGTGGDVMGGTGGSPANGGGSGTGGTGAGTGGIAGSTPTNGGAGTGGIAGSTPTNGGAGGAGTGGIAGSTPTNGGAGGAGTGGTGGSTAFELPGCVTALLASCSTTGACQATIGDAGGVDQVCYASGVRAAFTTVPNAAGCNGRMGVVQVFKADGSPCYSFEQLNNPNTACESGTVTWRDAAGLVVARGTVGGGGIYASVNVSCAGTTGAASCNSTIPCCRLTAFGTFVGCEPAGCTAGSCP